MVVVVGWEWGRAEGMMWVLNDKKKKKKKKCWARDIVLHDVKSEIVANQYKIENSCEREDWRPTN